LVDSERLIAQASILLFKELGVTVKTEDFKPFIGVGEQKFLEGMAQIHNIALPSDAKSHLYRIYNEIIKNNLHPIPGAVTFINNCKKRRLKLAVATSADWNKVDANFAAAGLIKSTFDAIVTGEHVIHKKPAPDIFLYAAKQLGLNPSECLVLEDAINGIIAANAAGCKNIGIAGTFSKEELFMANWTASDLSNIPDEALSW
jgi:beta-phosphoglucomutase